MLNRIYEHPTSLVLAGRLYNDIMTFAPGYHLHQSIGVADSSAFASGVDGILG